MLMEHSAETSQGTENGKNSRLLDLQKLYNTKPWVSAGGKGGSQGRGSSSKVLKRKLGVEDHKRVTKKSKKEVLLSSLSSGKKSKTRGSGVRRGELSSASTQLGKSESRDDQKVNGVGGLGSISLNLNANVSIPKRPRDLVGRKKVEVDPGTKLDGALLSSKASLDEGNSKLNDNPSGSSLRNGNIEEKLDQNGGSEGVSRSGIVADVKQKKDPEDRTKGRSRGSNSHLNLKREDSHVSIHNGDVPKPKAKRSRKKTKEVKKESAGATKRTNQGLDQSSRTCDGSQDDEENLEANAARMLSSRFDTSCTGYSSGDKTSKLPSPEVLSALNTSTGDGVAPQPNSRAESDALSSDGELRVLRPRDQHKGKGLLRKRRHFYEVLSWEMDSYWVLNRRIKVFWPLDQSWYVGQVIAFDPDKKLHHIKYDDRDEEWVDLQNERFKLLLLPSEVPGKVGSKKSRMHDSQARKAKRGKTAEKEKTSTSYMESEPIISWLAHSARQKSPTFGTRKKQRTLSGSAKSQLSSLAGLNIDSQGSLDVGSSGRDADDLVCSSASLETPVASSRDRNPLVDNPNSYNHRPPIVYFRRRYHRREQQGNIHSKELCQPSEAPLKCGNEPDFVDSFDLGSDMLPSMVEYGRVTTRLSPDEFIWNTDGSGVLKLAVPVANLKVFRLRFHLPLPVMIDNLFRRQCCVHLFQNGRLISLWPMIHLEMLFVDNIVGLRFLLYEGSLRTAVFLLSLVMDVFHRSNQSELLVDQQLPVTSIRFRFTGLQDPQKQLVFTFYNFIELAHSKWCYLDRKLKQHCLLTKQLPPSECTYDNIKALRNGCNRLPLTCVARKPSSVVNVQKRSRQQRTIITSKQSTCVRLNTRSCGSDDRQGKLPSFALSFAAAPTFFLSLHLKLLMERSIPPSSFGELDPVSLMDFSDHSLLEGSKLVVPSGGKSELESCSNRDRCVSVLSSDHGVGVGATAAHSFQAFPETDANTQLVKGKALLTEPDSCHLSGQPFDANGQLHPVVARSECSLSTGLTVKIPSADPIEGDADGAVQSSQCSAKLALDPGDRAVHSPSPSGSRNIWHRSRVGGSISSASMNLSPTWSDGKQDVLRNGFGIGPKKPRTQVSYSLPFGGHDYSSKYKFHHAKGFPHKRIRRASDKKTSEALTTSQRSVELLSCDANVLVTAGDRGWRECGAKVVLELDHNEWRLAVKLSGDTKYSYKAHQFLQPGTTNRYTHAMMWKGGKDWILEFPDRSQWAMFKEMHEECYNRNFRAASVKNIPIPGVHIVEETDDNVPEVPFVRPSPKYHRQLETDVDIATDPGRVLYDMDSDDEQWIAKHRTSGSNDDSGYGDILDEIFEKAMDVFEKVAYAKQRDYLNSDELEELAELGPIEAIKIIHEHWQEKRQRKGMPLIRHLQPPLWEKYQQQVKEWEQAMMKSSASGCHEKPVTIEKPPMFAFCLKPRGLEVPNRGSKHRSQKKLPVGAIGGAVPGDHDTFHLVGRRLNGHAFGDERVIYTAYNQGGSDTSPVLQGSARMFSPRDAGGVGYFSLSSDGSEKSHYPKLYRNKSKKLCFISSSNDQQPFASVSPRTMSRRIAIHGWNGSSSERYSPRDHHTDGFRRPSYEQLDPSELDEFRLRDAASAARHAVTVAKMKRENAQRMLCRADLAMHKAVTAIMTADAINASYKEPDDDV